MTVTGIARIPGSTARWLVGDLSPNSWTKAITDGFIAAKGRLP